MPDEFSVNDSRLRDRVNIKYQCPYDYIWDLVVKSLLVYHRRYELHFSMWDSKEPIQQDQYRSLSRLDSERNEVDEALSDRFHFVATLADVDGALVMTNRFRLLGFGAEVTAFAPSLKNVTLALDAVSENKKVVPVEDYGTRHRSALRFCSSYEDSIAFIMSQDGGVKAAKRVGADVLMWPDVVLGYSGLGL